MTQHQRSRQARIFSYTGEVGLACWRYTPQEGCHSSGEPLYDSRGQAGRRLGRACLRRRTQAQGPRQEAEVVPRIGRSPTAPRAGRGRVQGHTTIPIRNFHYILQNIFQIKELIGFSAPALSPPGQDRRIAGFHGRASDTFCIAQEAPGATVCSFPGKSQPPLWVPLV